MFTAFDLIQLAAIPLGAGIGWELGDPDHRILGAIAGAAVGLLAGRLPFVIALFLAGRHFRAQSSGRLRARIRGDEYYISHLLLGELLRRGEDVSGELEPVLELLRSDDADRRRFGWACLQLAFPAEASKVGAFDPQEPVERCRERVAVIAGPRATEP